MRIKKISATQPDEAPFDLKQFSRELRELSTRHGVKLVSLGAMSGLDSGAKGTTYLAIWATMPDG
jgi:hypothetical protein